MAGSRITRHAYTVRNWQAMRVFTHRVGRHEEEQKREREGVEREKDREREGPATMGSPIEGAARNSTERL